MTRLYVATAANFFFPGLGWLILGRKRLLGAIWLLGMIVLTYVETSLQVAAPALYWPMFGAVFAINTAFAIDTYRTGRT
ncbi:MAG: hypothetical protein FJ102_03195 [Deltaproteobacteria bacterium]|nr:hypothetical protein [Deltaproteobacteria bacterium]